LETGRRTARELSSKLGGVRIGSRSAIGSSTSPPRLPSDAGAGHASVSIDDPDLCPPLPHPRLVSTEMLGALQGVVWPPPLVSSDMLGALKA